MDVERSDWEIAIEQYIRREFPRLRLETNNRSIIPSRNTRSSYLEIDVFIPELSLGIEANGETYHHREQYRNDQMRSTEYSDEMYKENYCESVGIELLHVWSSEDMESIRLRIGDAIRRRLTDPRTEEWYQTTRSSSLAGVLDRLEPVDFMFLVYFVLPGVPMTLFLTWTGGGGTWLVKLWAWLVVSWVVYRWLYARTS